MEPTYMMDVSHCEVSPYVKEVTIATIRHADNSDNLDIATFEETGRFALVGRDNYKPGDRVLFIPADSVLPAELSDGLGITKYTSNGRIRVAKLRGNRSEGLVVERKIVEPFLPHIMKWEDPPSMHMSGDTRAARGIALEFEKFYKMPNLLDEPNTFEYKERLVYSEKRHGVNFRFGYLMNPQTEEYELYVGSHNVVLKENRDNLYWQVVRKLLSNSNITSFDEYLKDLVFYGEICGRGIQHLHYGFTEPTPVIFAIKLKYEYLMAYYVESMCKTLGFPVVKYHPIMFKSIEQMRELADTPSELTEKHMREGIVLTSLARQGKMAKVIGFEYLTQDKSRNKKKRTERH